MDQQLSVLELQLLCVRMVLPVTFGVYVPQAAAIGRLRGRFFRARNG